MDNNKFTRYAYSPRYNYDTSDLTDSIDYSNQNNNMVVFSGGDLQAYINNIKVGNLESITWSISVEVVGNYVMGRRDAVVYTTGKRVVVGSIVLSQYDRHALLEQVFQVSTKGPATIGALWTPDYGAENNVGQKLSGTDVLSTTMPGGIRNVDFERDGNASVSSTTGGELTLQRGLSRQAFDRYLLDQLRDTARAISSQKFSYSDQLPPFDLTLVGVTKSGDAARCSIFGMQVTQETAGFSQNDLGNSVGMSFVALSVSPWRAIEFNSNGSLRIPATS